MYNIIPSLEKIEEKLDQLYDKAEDILEIVQECCDNEEGQAIDSRMAKARQKDATISLTLWDGKKDGATNALH